MASVLPVTWDFARRLIAIEKSRGKPSSTTAETVICVFERIQLPLIRLAGLAGFRTLLSRALALAKLEDRSLDSAFVHEDGSLSKVNDTDSHSEYGIVILAHFLNLLILFIGEPLTRQLMRDAWPDAPVETVNESFGEQR